MSETIGIFAHVDAGKTTLSEQFLYKMNVIRMPGKVDKKETFMDHSELEKSRGITIFADEAHFETDGEKYSLIDTPGHIDFSGEMERSLLAVDCAILVISAVEGVQSHTETIWKLLKKYDRPCIIFINKMDRETADSSAVLKYINNKWNADTVCFEEEIKNNCISGEMKEEISVYDENLMEEFLSDEIDNEKFIKKASELMNKRVFFPVIKGSAAEGKGVDTLISVLKTFFNESLCTAGRDMENKKFRAVVYKIRHDKNGMRNAFVKVLQGKAETRDEIEYINKNGIKDTFKINEIKQFNGEKSVKCSEALYHGLYAITGAEDVKPGDIIGENPEKGKEFTLVPLMQSKIIYDEKNTDIHKMMKILKEIEDEEMLLNVSFSEETKTINIQVMGEIQLETLKEIVRDRYNLEIEFGESEIIYKETIKNAVVGCGHYEPLKHYAEVHLKLEASEEGSGISFESMCHVDTLALNYQNLIKTHVFEKKHKGVLTGSEITDIKIILLSGRAHLKHTEGGDFRQAVYRAVRQGLMQAESILLEPFYKFSLSADQALIGKILTDIQNLGGTYEIEESLEETEALITGRCPVRTMQKYVKKFMIMTKGKGKISLVFDGYSPCQCQEEIVQKKGYRPEGDVQNTADSVFCSHGAGYGVKWSEAAEKMHIPVEQI